MFKLAHTAPLAHVWPSEFFRVVFFSFLLHVIIFQEINSSLLSHLSQYGKKGVKPFKIQARILHYAFQRHEWLMGKGMVNQNTEGSLRTEAQNDLHKKKGKESKARASSTKSPTFWSTASKYYHDSQLTEPRPFRNRMKIIHPERKKQIHSAYCHSHFSENVMISFPKCNP